MSTSATLLNQFPINRTRRNHALEHATLKVLARKHPPTPAAGYSDWKGITIVGNFTTAEIQEAVEEARARLQAGEHNLAIHPHCGTNYAASGMLAGGAAWLALLGSSKNWRARLNRLPLVMALVTLVFILTLPLGPFLQRQVTTDAHIGSLEVVEIKILRYANITVHRILTRN